MRKRLFLFLLTFTVALLWIEPTAAQKEDASAGSDSTTEKSAESGESAPEPAAVPEEAAPPAAPSVTRSTGGIIMVTGVGSAEPVAKVEGEVEEPKTEEGAEKAEEAAPPASEQQPAQGQPAQGPQSRSVSTYTRGPNGVQRSTGITVSSSTDGDTRTLTRTLENLHGRSVPYLTESERVVNPTPGEQVTEKRTHRYDTAGNPVSQQLVREEERFLPDGTRQKTTTVYESDINGRMNPVERIVEETKKVGNVTRSVTTAERPDINKRFQTYERSESERTQQGEAVAKEVSTRQVDNGVGRMVEVERTESAMSRSGNTATTETKVWKRSVVNADRFDLAGRTVGKLVENPDGSTNETVEVFASSSGGSAANLNATGGNDVQQRIERETRKAADGGTVETTTTQSRSIADPSRFGAKEVQKQVTRPTATGKTIETHSYEEGVNGRLRPIGTTVERIENK